jgi:hypothetical protein
MDKIDVVKEVKELKNQLAYSKNIGFFFGAGTSCALNIPNIETLTKEVEKGLKKDNLSNFIVIRDDLKANITGRKVNIEDILNQIRRIRELTNDKKNKDFLKVSGEAAKNLDKEVCSLIYSVIDKSESKADLTNTSRFFSWLNILNREYSKEIFTTNYDLIIEKALEASQMPYFDGFVGAYEPFFLQESVDKFVNSHDMTNNWIRLWKIHGSLSWFWKIDSTNDSLRIIRVGKFDESCIPDNELVIYPSKDKYDSSRKQPFIAYFDRLKNYLLSGELLFIFTGYSFSDQHINEIIFNCLRQNKRLFCIIFFFQDIEVENLHKLISPYMNLSVFGPTKAIMNGNLCEWEYKKDDVKDEEIDKVKLYWDEPSNNFKLGDFNELVNFLISYSGKSELLEIVKK